MFFRCIDDLGQSNDRYELKLGNSSDRHIVLRCPGTDEINLSAVTYPFTDLLDDDWHSFGMYGLLSQAGAGGIKCWLDGAYIGGDMTLTTSSNNNGRPIDYLRGVKLFDTINQGPETDTYVKFGLFEVWDQKPSWDLT